MNQTISDNLTLLARDRYDTVDFVRELWRGETSAWIVFAAIAGTIAFFALYKKITGEDFVKSKEERREARKRRKHVLWEYKRDD